MFYEHNPYTTVPHHEPASSNIHQQGRIPTSGTNISAPTATDAIYEPKEEELKQKAARRNKTVVQTVALVTAIAFASGFGVSIWSTIDSIIKDKSISTPCKKKDGNEDMYGLGIRLGIYIQLVVTSIVDIFGRSQHTSLSLAPSSLWFLLALFVALMRMNRDPETYAIESYILISLGNGITWVLLGGAIKLDPLKLREPVITSFSRFVIWALWRSASSVYWWNFKKVAPNAGTGTSDCTFEPWGWLIVRVRLSNASFQTLHKICNIISWTALAQGIVPYLFGMAFFIHLVRKIDLTDLRNDQIHVSKMGILCDYLFVEVGELRGLIFGIPKASSCQSGNLRSVPDGTLDDSNLPLEWPWRGFVDQSYFEDDHDTYLGLGQILRDRGVSEQIENNIKLRLKKHIRNHYMQLPTPGAGRPSVTSHASKPSISTSTPRPVTPGGPPNRVGSFGPMSPSSIPYGPEPFPYAGPADHTTPYNWPGYHGAHNPTPYAPPPISPHSSAFPTSTTKPPKTQANSSHKTPLSWMYGIIDSLASVLIRYQLHHFPYLAFWDTCSVVLTILTVEFSLKLNNMGDVNDIASGGQLIAFIVGLGGAFIAAGNFYVEKRTVIISQHAHKKALSGDSGNTKDMHSQGHAGPLLSFSPGPLW